MKGIRCHERNGKRWAKNLKWDYFLVERTCALAASITFIARDTLCESTARLLFSTLYLIRLDLGIWFSICTTLLANSSRYFCTIHLYAQQQTYERDWLWERIALKCFNRISCAVHARIPYVAPSLYHFHMLVVRALSKIKYNICENQDGKLGSNIQLVVYMGFLWNFLVGTPPPLFPLFTATTIENIIFSITTLIRF